MAYNDTEWIDNSLPPIDEVNLNKMEQGITDAHSHMANTNNPHLVNKTDVGLSNVNNTSDINKPVSTATQAALNLKSGIGHVHDGADAVDHLDLLNIGTNTHTQIDIKLDQALYESDALSAVDDTNKLITETELDAHTGDTANPHLTTVVNLDDTNIIEPSEGQRLAYNEVTGKWEARNSTSGLGYVTFDYKFSTDITDTPASGRIQLNNIDPALATEMYIHHIDNNGDEEDAYWNEIKEHDWFNLYQSNDTDTRYQYDIIGSGTQNGEVWTFPISYYIHNGTISNNQKVKLLWRISQTQVINNLVTPRADWSLSANMGVVLKADVDTKTEWKGLWVNASYTKNDMARDGAYTGIANKDTANRLAPQDIGVPYYLYAGTLNDFENTASQILYGNRYTASVAEKLVGYRIYVTAGNSYKVYFIENPESTAVATLLHSFTADSTGWLNIDGSGIIVGIGFMFDLIVYATEPNPTPIISLLNYDYRKPNNPGTPSTGEMEHSNNDTANLKVHKTDDDGNDNSAFLEGLHIGDIIELETIRWAIQNIINSGTYMTYQVSPAVQYGATGVYNIGFETIEATPISYGMEIDANIATPHSGLYIADGKWEDIIPDDNQYGIDIYVQEISISDDWDIIAASGSVGAVPSEDVFTDTIKNKNIIVNGNFIINQENGENDIVMTSNSWKNFSDVFHLSNRSAGQFTTSNSTMNYRRSKKFTVDIATSDFTTNKVAVPFSYIFEGYDLFSEQGKDITISFLFRTNKIGIYTIAFGRDNLVTQDSYVSEFIVENTNTIERYSITIPLLETWTENLQDDNNRAFILGIATINEGTYEATSINTWLMDKHRAASSNNVNWMDTVGNYIEIAEVQLERGSVATKFEEVSYDEQLGRVQRYFERIEELVYGYGLCTTTTKSEIMQKYKSKRVIPLISDAGYDTFHTLAGASVENTEADMVYDLIGKTQVRITATSTGLTAGQAGGLINKAGSYIDIDARM